MQVDKVSFYPLLLDLLTDISEAHFVALDLELSGVPVKQTQNRGPGKPSLQDRYLEIKEAAERYQILQIGLTCVQQDVERGKYVLKPYNFELSPLVEERGLDIDRTFSFHSGAVDFLLRVNFDLSVPFYHGIPYLSRAETKEARQKFATRQDKTRIADIDIKPTEIESLAFLDHVRNEINKWLTSRSQDTAEYVNISKAKNSAVATTINDVENEEPYEALSRFEKRLVHQLVRAEYPTLVTISKRDFIQIVRFDKAREDRIAADRLRELEERINRQKGFRWVIEALHGGRLDKLDLRECARDPISGMQISVDMDDYRARFHRAANLLRGNPRMMVGHNCFLDLIYIYRTFIGTLPSTMEGFQKALHEVWPQIVDTKYMSTHNCGDINPVSSLEQIAGQLSNEATPVLELDKEHVKYAGDVEMLHEAGYDSYLTAGIAVRLSAKLKREGAASGLNGLDGSAAIANGVNGLKISSSSSEIKSTSDTNHDPSAAANGFTPSVEGGRWHRKGDPSLPAPDPNDPFQQTPNSRKHRHIRDGDQAFAGGMPSLNDGFWKVYGNKLRVFGTREGICELAPYKEDIETGLEEDEDGEGAGQGGVGV